MIAERRARQAELQAEFDRVESEITVLLEVQQRSKTVSQHSDSPATKVTQSSSVSDPGAKRVRPLKSDWKRVLHFIGRRGSASLDDIMSFSEAEGLAINRNTLRSQASIYTGQGWLKRLSAGVFQLTPEGAAKSEFNKNESPDVDTPSDPSGGVAERFIAPDSKSGGDPAHHGDQSPAGSNPAASASIRRDLLSSSALPSVISGRESGVGAPSLPSSNRQSRS